ncbi:MAG: transporter substrate-binding domain-containing protein [Proteobacteria bacterium]|nr:transporter substrate-binding domain-containing protein [Pseudomonadota bacterium]
MQSNILLNLIFITTFISSLARSETIRLRADEWCPYTCDAESKQPGFMVEIAKLAFESAGHRLEYKSLNWARSIADARLGKIDGIVGAAKSDAPDFIFPRQPIAVQHMCFFKMAENPWQYQSIKSLENIVLGAIKDYAYFDELDAYIKSNTKNPARIDLLGGDNPLELNVKKLLAKRIGTFIDDRAVTQRYLQKLGEKADKIQLAACAQDSELFIAFSPKHPKAREFSELIEVKLKSMQKDGSLKKLADSYGIVQ